MMTREPSKRLQGTDVSCYSVTPGLVNTSEGGKCACLCQPMIKALFRDVWTVSQTVLYCAMQEGIEHESGLVFDNCHVHALPKLAKHDDIVKDSYEVTLKVIPENFLIV